MLPLVSVCVSPVCVSNTSSLVNEEIKSIKSQHHKDKIMFSDPTEKQNRRETEGCGGENKKERERIALCVCHLPTGKPNISDACTTAIISLTIISYGRRNQHSQMDISSQSEKKCR